MFARAEDTSAHLRVPVSVHRQASNVSRRTDSGVSSTIRCDPQGDISPRSGSISESSTSPEKGTSESSSGVHSSASLGNSKRCSSMENVELISLAKPPWKSMSLQRGVVPPPVAPPATILQRKRIGEAAAHVEAFGRNTSVRLTSFTDHQDFPSSPLQYAARTHQRRDSANYSLASSAESESSVQHT